LDLLRLAIVFLGLVKRISPRSRGGCGTQAKIAPRDQAKHSREGGSDLFRFLAEVHDLGVEEFRGEGFGEGVDGGLLLGR